VLTSGLVYLSIRGLIYLSVIEWGVMQGKTEKEGIPMSSIDSLIAATAYTHNLILVTRNEEDFQASKLSIINPWNDEEND